MVEADHTRSGQGEGFVAIRGSVTEGERAKDIEGRCGMSALELLRRGAAGEAREQPLAALLDKVVGEERSKVRQRDRPALAQGGQLDLLPLADRPNGSRLDDHGGSTGALDEQGRRCFSINQQRGVQAQRVDLTGKTPDQARRRSCRRSRHRVRPTTGRSCPSCLPSASS
ncbi:MAG: hypothetical protein LC656_11435 [Sphingomonadales bacterium]|nr:hypothetical protein [Sphingomonadales bacterium]